MPSFRGALCAFASLCEVILSSFQRLDVCHTKGTLHDMKVLMDADCLIKLTKAQLKETVCAVFDVSIPSVVRREVMRNAAAHPECLVIRGNLESGSLSEVPVPGTGVKGEDAALAAYNAGGYAGIASDDKRFTKKLQLLGIPYISAAVFVLLLVKRGRFGADEAAQALGRLAPMVSDDEIAVVRLKLESL